MVFVETGSFKANLWRFGRMGVANLPLYDVCNEVELMISKESGDDGIKVAMNDIHQNDIDFKIFDEGICW